MSRKSIFFDISDPELELFVQSVKSGHKLEQEPLQARARS